MISTKCLPNSQNTSQEHLTCFFPIGASRCFGADGFHHCSLPTGADRFGFQIFQHENTARAWAGFILGAISENTYLKLRKLMRCFNLRIYTRLIISCELPSGLQVLVTLILPTFAIARMARQPWLYQLVAGCLMKTWYVSIERIMIQSCGFRSKNCDVRFSWNSEIAQLFVVSDPPNEIGWGHEFNCVSNIGG